MLPNSIVRHEEGRISAVEAAQTKLAHSRKENDTAQTRTYPMSLEICN